MQKKIPTIGINGALSSCSPTEQEYIQQQVILLSNSCLEEQFDYYSFTQDPVNESIIEIKQMVECTHPKVLERIKEKQEKQNKYQDSRNTVENEKLDIGDKVTVGSMKIQGN
jgi:hypothetical protein